MANMAAASVDDMMEPMRSDSSMGVWRNQFRIIPVNIAVMNTPIVARVSPCPNIGLTSLSLVSNPPEKRIITKTIIPINCVMLGLSK